MTEPTRNGEPRVPYIEYSSNNSGGSWWLSDDNWRALEDAGWVVHWVHDPDDPSHEHSEPPGKWAMEHHHGYTDPLLPATSNGERWLGALAKSAAKVTDDPEAAIAEWERVTHQAASDEGCNCCGPPHSFTFYRADGTRSYTSVEVARTELRWS